MVGNGHKLSPLKDYEKMLSYWRDDAVIIMPNQAPVKGKAAIRAMVESTAINPAFSEVVEPLEAHILTMQTWDVSLNVIR